MDRGRREVVNEEGLLGMSSALLSIHGWLITLFHMTFRKLRLAATNLRTSGMKTSPDVSCPSVTGRKVKRVKISLHFDDNDFAYPDESSWPPTNLDDSEAEALEGWAWRARLREDYACK